MDAVFLAVAPAGVSRTKLSPVLARPLSVYCSESVHRQTCTAADLTPEAVSEAIDAAKDGDTVQLPEGTMRRKRPWNTERSTKIKAITVQGDGIDKTIIRDDPNRNGNDEPFAIMELEICSGSRG